MDFENEKIYLSQIINKMETTFSVDENVIIPDIKPDILSTINTCGNIYVYKKEIINGKIRIDGGVQTYIMYFADNEQNSISGLHTSIDFSQSIDLENVQNDMDLSCKLCIKNIECKILNGRKVNVKVEIEAKIITYLNEEKELLKSITNNEGIQMISNSVTVNSVKGKGETVALAKDTVSVDNDLADILDVDICVKNKDMKVSYNKVLSKADVIAQILYLTEDGKINSITAQIPIMGFIDINGVSENDICDMTYEMRNINIKPNNTDEKSIYLEIEFLIGCNAYENKEINLIQDLYSPEKDIKVNQEKVCLMQNKDLVKDSFHIKNRVNIPELKDGKVYNIKVTPNIIKANTLKQMVSYEGELILSILYESNVTNHMEEKELRLPFTHDVNSDKIGKDYEINTEIEISTKDYMSAPDNTIELDVGIDMKLDMYKRNDMSIVNNISIEDIKDDSKGYSLIIYFVKEGDTLWKIAKKFRSTTDEIAEINGIDNVDKINVGDRLYIPKYVYNRIS